MREIVINVYLSYRYWVIGIIILVIIGLNGFVLPTYATNLINASKFSTTIPDGSIRIQKQFLNAGSVYMHTIERRYDSSRYFPDGNYVFQVTDRQGRTLLSSDRSACRIIRVENGRIVGLRKPLRWWYLVDRSGNDSCQIQDNPNGAAGSSLRHDTNKDQYRGYPALSVQLMPFVQIPNSNQTYRLWLIPWYKYLLSGGRPYRHPVSLCNEEEREDCEHGSEGTGFRADRGFRWVQWTTSQLFKIKNTETNRPPTANAGPDRTITISEIVNLDGRGSNDPEGDRLSFIWTLTGTPTGSNAYLIDEMTDTPKLETDLAGSYEVTLVVNDGHQDSTPDTVTFSTVNSPPVANAGPDSTNVVNAFVTLDGSGSTDVDGDALTYSWSLIDRPPSSSTMLDDASLVNPGFILDRAGTYIAELTVNDGEFDSDPDSVQISTVNSPPIADAGVNQSVQLGEFVQLNGSGSTDVDGDSLSYLWSLLSVPTGSNAALSESTNITSGFIADLPGSYSVQLIVNDGTDDSVPDTTVVSTVNSPPVANAGPDQTSTVGETVTLDGSASTDVDGDSLTYNWSFSSMPSGSSVTFSDQTIARPRFVIDLSGTYVIQLIVDDGTVESVADTVEISTVNSQPVANAGSDQSVFLGETVVLDGSQSNDPDGDRLTYLWSISDKPANSSTTLSDLTVAGPSFFVDVPGDYIFQLLVNDGLIDSQPDTVVVTTENTVPVADAGPEQTGTIGQSIVLDGSNSADADGDSLNYSWSLISVPSGSTAILSNPTSVTSEVVLDLPGTYIAQLIVNDGVVDSSPDTIVITTGNTAPVADAGPDQRVRLNTLVTLDGLNSVDDDGDALTYAWSIIDTPNGSNVMLSDPSDGTPTFRPDVRGAYEIQLIVNDGLTDSPPDTVQVMTINTPPVANAGFDQAGLLGISVDLNGQDSFDADGDSLSYSWSFASQPNGSTVTLDNQDSVNASFTPDQSGSYLVMLVVNDGIDNSNPDETVVTVNTSPNPPVLTPVKDVTIGVGSDFEIQLEASDVDGDPLTYSLLPVGIPNVDFNNSIGLFVFNPDISQIGDHEFTFSVSDGTHIVSDTATITVELPAQLPGCVDLGASCGALSDGFGNTLQCGVCQAPETCGGGSQPNVCGLAALPPDPQSIVPPAPNGVNSNMMDAYDFFFSGPVPIQQGTDISAFEAHRISGIKGRVIDRSGAPIAGARIDITDDPSLGYTFSRADGNFDLLVEAGGQVRLSITQDLFLPVQRRVNLDWESYANLNDIVLTPQNPQGTDITLDNVSGQIAEGAVETDVDGSRQAVVFVPSGTTATVKVNGVTEPFMGGRLRITEFTVGGTGPEAMPAPLPGGSAYTYAADFSFDEVGPLARVEYSDPVSIYLDNFLNFPVGYNVPVGSYDYDVGQWQPEPDGKVIEVVSITSGLVDLDINTSPGADSSTELLELGIGDEERAVLAERYNAGDTFWRVSANHFTPLDLNATGRRRLPPDPPEQPDVEPLTGDCESEASGSIIRCQSQTLGEQIPVAGTPHILRYQSDRIEANQLKDRTLRFNLQGYDVPASSEGIRIRVEVLGRVIEDITLPAGTEFHEVEWDGLDALGRKWNRPAVARYSIEVDTGWEYLLNALNVGVTTSFSKLGGSCDLSERCCGGGGAVSVPSSRIINDGNRVGVRNTRTKVIGGFSVEQFGLGGFYPEDYHAYSPLTGTLYLGNGSTLRTNEVRSQAGIIAGAVSDHDGVSETIPGSSKDTDLSKPDHIAVSPNGDVYFSQDRTTIWRISQGEIEPVLLNAFATPLIWLALQDLFGAANFSRLNASIGQIEIDDQGRIYLLWKSPSHHLIRLQEFDDGRWLAERIAGTERSVLTIPIWQEGEPLSERHIGIEYFAIAPDGTIYLNTRRQLNPDVYAYVERMPDGTGRTRFTPDFDSSRLPAFDVGPDGSFYLMAKEVSNLPRQLVRVLPGESTEILSGNVAWSDVDVINGEPIKDFKLDRDSNSGVTDIEVLKDGSIYLVLRNPRVRPILNYLFKITNGTTRRVTLGGVEPPNLTGLTDFHIPDQEGGSPGSIALGPNNELYVIEQGTERILNLGGMSNSVSPAAHTIPSRDGSEVYHFTDTGEHIRTVDPLTGVTLRQFEHDDDGRLISITDADGQITRIQRPDPNTIVFEAPPGPGGSFASTTVILNNEGYADTIVDPEGATWAFDYENAPAGRRGLLTAMWRPRQNVNGPRSGMPSRFNYERYGGDRGQARLVRDEDPVGGIQTLTVSDHTQNYSPITSEWCDGSIYTTGWQQQSVESAVTRTTASGESIVYSTSTQQINDPKTSSIRYPNGRIESTKEPNGAGLSKQSWPGAELVTHEITDPIVGANGKYVDEATLNITETTNPPRQAIQSIVTRNRTASVTGLGTVTAYREETTLNETETHVTEWDGATRILRTISPENRMFESVLDDKGRVAETRIPGQVPTIFRYDNDGRLRFSTRTSGGITREIEYNYDALGYLLSVTSEANSIQTHRTIYPNNDRRGLPREIDILGRGSMYLSHDVEGAITAITPPDSFEHQFEYSSVGLSTEYRPPNVPSVGTGACEIGASCTEYENANRISRITRPDGETVVPSYNSMTGDVESLLISDEGTWNFRYDPHGRLIEETSPDGNVLRTAYQADLPVQLSQTGTHTLIDLNGSEVWTGSLDGQIDVTYNNRLRVDRVAVQSGLEIQYGYDSDGNIASIADVNGSTPEFILTTSDLDGRVTDNSIGTTSQSLRFDSSLVTPGFGDLSRSTYHAGSREILNTQFQYDLLGRIIRKDERILGVNRQRNYEYDTAGRLIRILDVSGSVLASYEYDGHGNRTLIRDQNGVISLSANEIGCDIDGDNVIDKAADKEDKLCRYGDLEFTYDLNGQLREKRNALTSEVTMYYYDGQGQLDHVVLPDNRIISYLYDARGRRVAKFMDGNLERGWLYKDDINPIAQLDSSGNIEATFIYGTKPHVPDYMVRTDGSTFRIVTDYRGSVRFVVNVTTGVIAERIDYDEWGNVIDNMNGWSVQSFGYAGGLHEYETGLIRFGVRDYDPTLGRWTAKDPSGFTGGSNFYLYSANDPVNFIDATGKLPTIVVDSAEWIEKNGIDDFAAGFGDSLSFGLTRLYRNWLFDGNSGVDTCSTSYAAGSIAGFVASIPTGAAVGSISGGSFLVSRIVAQSGGSITKAITLSNTARATQKQAVEIIIKTTVKSGRGVSGSALQADRSILVYGGQISTTTSSAHVARVSSNGSASIGTIRAKIANINIKTGKITFENSGPFIPK